MRSIGPASTPAAATAAAMGTAAATATAAATGGAGTSSTSGVPSITQNRSVPAAMRLQTGHRFTAPRGGPTIGGASVPIVEKSPPGLTPAACTAAFAYPQRQT